MKCWIQSSELNFVVLIFVAPRIRTSAIGTDDVIILDGWPKYSFNDIVLHCTA